MIVTIIHDFQNFHTYHNCHLSKLVTVSKIGQNSYYWSEFSQLFAIVHICTVTIIVCHNRKQLSQLFRIATIGHLFHDLSKLWLLKRIFTINHNWSKLSQLVKIVTTGQNCHNWSKLLVKIVRIGQDDHNWQNWSQLSQHFVVWPYLDKFKQTGWSLDKLRHAWTYLMMAH